MPLQLRWQAIRGPSRLDFDRKARALHLTQPRHSPAVDIPSIHHLNARNKSSGACCIDANVLQLHGPSKLPSPQHRPPAFQDLQYVDVDGHILCSDKGFYEILSMHPGKERGAVHLMDRDCMIPIISVKRRLRLCNNPTCV